MKYSIPEFKVVRLQEEPAPLLVFDGPEKIWEIWEKVKLAPWFDSEKECVVTVCLDTKNKVKGFNLVSIGSLNECICNPREVFKPLIVDSAASFILLHNHPSKDPAPSQADIKTTRRILDSGEIIGIKLLDHLIVGDKRYYSFRESGYI